MAKTTKMPITERLAMQRDVELQKLIEFKIHLTGGAKNVETVDAGQIHHDPAYVFEQADKATEAAARVSAFNQILTAFAKDATMTVGDMRELLQMKVIRGARWPKHSTSFMANLMHEQQTAAYADILADYFVEAD